MGSVEDTETSSFSTKDQLLVCIKEESNARAKLILEKNPHLYHSIYESQYSLLHCCVISDNHEMVEYLLSKECTIDDQDNLGRTPFMIAIASGFDSVACSLLHAGANIDSKFNKRQQSALHLSLAEHKMSTEFYEKLFIEYQRKFTTKENMVEELIKAGIHLYQAVALKDVSVINLMLDLNHSANSKNYLYNTTALHSAVYFDEPEIVRLLLEKGADATAIDQAGKAPLHYLYYYNIEDHLRKLEILKIFINSRVSMTFCATEISCLPIAASLVLGNHEIIRTVLQSSPDFSAQDGYGNTMLHYLVRNKNPGLIDELKPYINKMDINAVNKKKSSPFFYALRFRRFDMLELLLENKASLDFNFITLTGFCSAKKLKFYVSYLAMIEQRGIPLPKTFCSIVNSSPPVKNYYKKCRQALQNKIFGSVTVFKLLTNDYEKIALYLNQEEFNLKLNRMKYRSKLVSCFPYYNSIIRKHLSEGRIRKTLKYNAVRTFCKIHDNRMGIVANQIVNDMSNHDLQQFCQVY